MRGRVKEGRALPIILLATVSHNQHFKFNRIFPYYTTLGIWYIYTYLQFCEYSLRMFEDGVDSMSNTQAMIPVVVRNVVVTTTY